MADVPLTGAGLYTVLRGAANPSTPVTLPAGQVVVTGVDVNTVSNNGKTKLRLVGTAAGTPTTGLVKVAAPGAVATDGLSAAGITRDYTLTATMDAVVGPFPTSVYGTQLRVTVSGATAGAKLTALLEA